MKIKYISAVFEDRAANVKEYQVVTNPGGDDAQVYTRAGQLCVKAISDVLRESNGRFKDIIPFPESKELYLPIRLISFVIIIKENI